MKKKTVKVIGITAAALLAVIAAVCIIFSIIVGKQVAEGLLYQNAGNDTIGNSIKQLEEWNYDLAGFNRRYPARDIMVTAEDGNEVPAYVYEETTGGSTVILIHGLGGDHVCMAPVAELYLERGWNVITMDQRASGVSENDKVSFGYFEKLDIKALVEYAGKVMASSRVVVHGQSMGAASAALYAATGHAAENLDALILDSCFDNMENMFLGVWRGMSGTEGIPEDYVVGCGDWYLKQYYGFGFADADAAESLKQVTVDTLMLQMERDEIVPTPTAQKMFENIVAGRKEICYFDSEHVEGVIDDPQGYGDAVFSFLEQMD